MPSEQARHKAVENAVKAVASGDPFVSRASNEDWRKSAVRSLRLKAAGARRKMRNPDCHEDKKYLYERAMWCEQLACEIEDKR